MNEFLRKYIFRKIMIFSFGKIVKYLEDFGKILNIVMRVATLHLFMFFYTNVHNILPKSGCEIIMIEKNANKSVKTFNIIKLKKSKMMKSEILCCLCHFLKFYAISNYFMPFSFILCQHKILCRVGALKGRNKRKR